MVYRKIWELLDENEGMLSISGLKNHTGYRKVPDFGVKVEVENDRWRNSRGTSKSPWRISST